MVAPGPTAFTVIPYCASSIARQRVKWSTAAFDTQYAPISQRGTLAAVEPVLTMRPPRASIIDGTTAWQQRSMLLRFTSRTRRQSAGVTSRMDIEGNATPALFTSAWIGPNAWRTAATIASTDARWLTSAANAAAVPPARRMVSTVSSALRCLTSATATRAPCRANVSAAARPMPAPAPVIRTVLSVSERGISSSSAELVNESRGRGAPRLCRGVAERVGGVGGHVGAPHSGELGHAVDVEDRAGDVGRLLRRQVDDGGRG